MRLFVLGLILFAGCYQPSPAERYNIESEALDRINKDMEPLEVLKGLVDRGEANQQSVELWDRRKEDYNQLIEIRNAQLARVRESRRKLAP